MSGPLYPLTTIETLGSEDHNVKVIQTEGLTLIELEDHNINWTCRQKGRAY